MSHKNAVAIAADPGESPIIYQGEEFRIALFPDAPELCWEVYGGVDGTVVVFKPERGRWEKLRPTLKNNDYYFLSIAKVAGGYFQPYVQQVILGAFMGPPPSPGSVGKHLNDDPSDNRLANLKWGTKRENAEEAHRHRREGSAPLDRRIAVPIRRSVVARLREVGSAKGKLFEEFVERILVDYLRRIDEVPNDLR